MIKAVVFDMDGVLFDTERISCECFLEAAKQLKLQIPEEAVYGCLGLNQTDGKAHVLKCVEPFYPDGTFPYELWHQKVLELFSECLKDGAPVMKGVFELLDFLRDKKIKMAVASSTNYDRVMSNLTHCGINVYFSEVITGNMVEHSKPDPDIYLKACRALEVNPDQAMAVEDSPNGIRAAAAAGMVTVMVPDLIPATPELEKLFDMKFDSLVELRKYFESVIEG
ncbi:MAG: HAD family phosphatase [Lachnospiraceae bacterium]|nr:HAD family phosphatase [Lachnospiraceae bacterium]